MAISNGGPGEPAHAPSHEPSHDEPHDESLAARLNWLRAGVLGANDGIVSVAGIVVGVAGATSSRTTILTAGLAGLFAGAISMAAGEYVSVSTQRDTEQAALRLERRELTETPEAELGIDPDDLTNPWHAALSSFVAFTVGAVLPLLAIGLPPHAWRVPVTFIAVVAALVTTGWVSADLGGAPRWPAVRRNVIGGVLAMVVTYLIGTAAGSVGL